jgi:Flp pilus assembly pilin Flp
MRGIGMSIVGQFVVDEDGADLVEYALLIGLLSLAAIAGLGGVSDTMKTMFTTLSTRITGAF